MRSWQLAGLILVIVVGCATREPGDGMPLYRMSADEVVEPVPRPEAVRRAGNTSPYTVNGQTYRVMASNSGYRETGIASWYGSKFHGRKTANGETFNAYRASAAHRSLAIPSFVQVTNLENGASMVVRVNDRGPFHPDRIIDLSYAAAVKLGFDQQGTARVEVVALEVAGNQDLRDRSAQDAGLLGGTVSYRYIQVGAFSEQAAAHAVGDRLRTEMAAPVAVSRTQLGDDAFFRVRVGPVEDHQRLLALRDQIHELGYPEARLMPD